MRKIKFRIWISDKWVKENVPTRIEYYNGMIGMHHFYLFSFTDDGNFLTDRGELYRFPMNTVMQYTGIKDKNRKEIYESDLVKTKDGKIGYVIYFDEGCRYEIVHNVVGYKVPQYLATLDIFQKPEIIGNIYENPELITKEN